MSLGHETHKRIQTSPVQHSKQKNENKLGFNYIGLFNDSYTVQLIVCFTFSDSDSIIHGTGTD